MPTALAVEPHSSFLFLFFLYPPYTVPDVTSSSILSMTLVAPPSPMTSFAATPVTVATSVSQSNAALSHLASSSNQLLIAEMSSYRDNSIIAISSQFPLPITEISSIHDNSITATSSGSQPGTVIGAVVAVVIVLVVGSVIVAALLIAWRLRSRGKKDFTGKRSD